MNIQKPVTGYQKGKGLAVHSIFKTIQGEGVLVGTPSIFIRLYGCNLLCPMCDTDYTSNCKYESEDAMVKVVVDLAGYKISTVVITGGEPLNQPIGRLVDKLHETGFTIQIETNGSLYRSDIDYSKCIVVCSPKLKHVNRQLQRHIHSYKYVATCDGLLDDGLPHSVLGLVNNGRVFRPEKGSIIYLQPADEGDNTRNKNNTDAVLKSCIDNGFKLCLQTHKILGVE